jgi:putative transcriptional regulator
MAIVKVTPEMVARAIRDTDWAAIDALSEDDIARQVADDPDAAPMLSLPRVRAVLKLQGGRIATRHKFRLVRRALGMSQAEFARSYRFNLRTLQNWERGSAEPDEATLAYLTVIARLPEETKAAVND